MELNEFKKCLQIYLKKSGFEKIKNKYYRNGNGFLCMIHFFRSHYGPVYYFDYYFFIGNFEKPYIINQDNAITYTPFVGSRFYFSEKDTYSCEYLNYTEKEVICLLDKNMNERIFPPFEIGKKYLLDNFGKLYDTFLDKNFINLLLRENYSESN